jgi:hypothetical protein
MLAEARRPPSSAMVMVTSCSAFMCGGGERDGAQQFRHASRIGIQAIEGDVEAGIARFPQHADLDAAHLHHAARRIATAECHTACRIDPQAARRVHAAGSFDGEERVSLVGIADDAIAIDMQGLRRGRGESTAVNVLKHRSGIHVLPARIHDGVDAAAVESCDLMRLEGDASRLEPIVLAAYSEASSAISFVGAIRTAPADCKVKRSMPVTVLSVKSNVAPRSTSSSHLALGSWPPAKLATPAKRV